MTRHQFLQRAVLAQLGATRPAHDIDVPKSAKLACAIADAFADALEASGITWDDDLETSIIDALDALTDKVHDIADEVHGVTVVLQGTRLS